MNLEKLQPQDDPRPVAKTRQRDRLPRSTPLVIAVAALMLAIGGGGGAVAGSLITSKQIKNNTITTADIKNKTITSADLAASARKAGATGKTGPQGPAGMSGAPGAAGAAGKDGAAGAVGPRGFSAWDVIPSRVTVSGPLQIIEAATSLHSESSVSLGGTDVVLPGVAPTPLDIEDIRFGAHPKVDPEFVDAGCNGTVFHPTAPAGKVCVYVENTLGVERLSANRGLLEDRDFVMGWQITPGATDVVVVASWAYTAP